jgi:hypothetical protein
MFVGFFDRILRRCVIVSGCLAALSFGAAMVVILSFAAWIIRIQQKSNV